MSFTDMIKKYILNECKMDAVGIAPASALDDEPVGQRPEDILPGAKSIIVFTKKIPVGVIQSAFRSMEDGILDAFSSFAAYGSELTPNMSLFFMQFNISEYIERTFGYTTVPIPSGPMHNVTSSNQPLPAFVGSKRISMVLNPERAALAAGLGEIGWNNMLLTPENGPRQRIGLVLSTMELECDTPYSGPKLCSPSDCGICSRVCPVNAISTYGEEKDEMCVPGIKCEIARINTNACAVVSMAFRQEFSGKAKVPDLIMHNNPSDEELADAYAKKPLCHYSLDHYPKYYCNKCMLYCPVGGWKDKFADTGLSRFDEKELV